jgi:hypothetical protein
MRPITRKVTRRLLDAMAEGTVSQETVVLACLNYMSEADVADMCEIEGLFDFEDETEEDETEEDEGFLIDEL